jgi:hypothetical protein
LLQQDADTRKLQQEEDTGTEPPRAAKMTKENFLQQDGDAKEL